MSKAIQETQYIKTTQRKNIIIIIKIIVVSS